MYKLEDLNYLYQDLEPYIDTHTMGTHYNKHAKKYLNTLNQLLLENNFDFSLSLVELAQILIYILGKIKKKFFLI